jgi:hypothetical protein
MSSRLKALFLCRTFQRIKPQRSLHKILTLQERPSLSLSQITFSSFQKFSQVSVCHRKGWCKKFDKRINQIWARRGRIRMQRRFQWLYGNYDNKIERRQRNPDLKPHKWDIYHWSSVHWWANRPDWRNAICLCGWGHLWRSNSFQVRNQ